MKDFTLYTPTYLVFGDNKHKTVGSLLKGITSNVLIHYGSSRIVKQGLLKEVTDSLEQNNISYTVLGGVVPNPRIEKVYEGIKLVKEHHIDHIIAFGGGSVIDSAKAIALGACIKEDVWDYYYISRKKALNALKVTCILTIPAAGSENSSSSVITNEQELRKIGYQTDIIRPYISIINPLFFYTISSKDYAAGICDMMCHIFERYFTNTKNNDVVDAMSEGILRSIIKNANILVSNRFDYDANREIALASTFAHNGMLGIGRETDWASHQIEHELSALFDIRHGEGLSIVIIAWMKYVYKINKTIFKKFAINIMGITKGTKNSDVIILEAITALEDFFKHLGLATKLSEVGIDESVFEEIALKTTFEYYKETPRTIGGLKKLNSNDIINILKIAA